MRLGSDFWRFLAIAFGVSLAFSIFLNIIQYSSLNNLLNVSHGRKLIFLWPPNEQDIVVGTLRIEVFIDWESVPENLTLIVKVNDDDLSMADAIGLEFDSDGNNQIHSMGDKDYAFLANNKYYSPEYAVVWEGGINYPLVPPKPSPYHKCIFSNQTGYTFIINMPKNEINFHKPMLILLVYEDNAFVKLRVVFAQFKVT